MKKKRLLYSIISVMAMLILGLTACFAVILPSNKKQEDKDKDLVVITQASTGAKDANVSDKGGVIYLENGATYTMKDGQVSNISRLYGGVVYVSSGCTFNMEGGTISSANAEYGGAIYIESGGTVNISNGTIKTCNAVKTLNDNAADGGNGGAIYVESGATLNITGGTISNNTSEGSGAGICIESGALVTINNCVLNSNTATVAGGAIYANGAESLNINNSTFESNKTLTDHGGAIYCDGLTTLNITDSSFLQNQSNIEPSTINKFGGALYIGTTKATVTNIKDSQFIKNQAMSTGGRGGAFYASAGTVNITGDTNFVANSSINGGGGFASSGSSTVVNLGTEDLTWSGKVTGNTDNWGAGVFATGQSTINQRSGSIGGVYTYDETEYTGNVATSRGAGVHLYSNAKYNLIGGYITENVANSGNGGGVLIERGTFTMTGGEIFANKSGTEGAGVCISGSVSDGYDQKASLTGGKIYNNVSGSSGGGVYCVYEDSLEIKNVEISGNTASGNGGGICIGYGNSSFGTINIENATINENKASGSGGGIYHNVLFQTLCITDSEISQNQATNGAGVSINEGATFENTSITNNIASGYGGGLFLSPDQCDLVVDADCVIEGNSALCGGGVYLNYCTGPCAVTTIHCPISYNTANYGGGVYVNDYYKDNTSSAYISNISYNTATVAGGGLYVKNGMLSIGSISENSVTGTASVSSFTFKTAAASGTAGCGGGIYVETELNLYKTTITNNSATGNGGGVYIQEEGVLNILDSSSATVIQSNSATGDGGGVYLDGKLNFDDYSDQLTISSNTASGNGGGICIGAGSLPSCLVLISSNTATGDGGGIYNISDETMYLDEDFGISNNVASGNGGGIYCAKVSISGAMISNNTSTNDGAGVFVQKELTMSSGSISYNYAQYGNGGGVYCEDSAVTLALTGGSIYSNIAENGAGGGIYAAFPTISSFSNVSINSNTSGLSGGGMYLKSKENITFTSVSISSNTINDNNSGVSSAGFAGGLDYYNSGYTLTLQDCTVNGNTAKLYGGGIVMHTSSNITLSGTTTVNSNVVDNSGGAWGTTDSLTGAGIDVVNATLRVCDSSTISGNIIKGYENTVLGVTTGNSGLGSGVFVCDGGKVYMYDSGSLDTNYVSSAKTSIGGNVYIDSKSYFQMNGGQVKGDSSTKLADLGGGIASLGSVYLYSGEITGNNATNGGGVVSIGGVNNSLYSSTGYLYISNCSISGNAATSNANDVACGGTGITLDREASVDIFLAAAKKNTILGMSDNVYPQVTLGSGFQNFPNSISFGTASLDILNKSFTVDNDSSLMQSYYLTTNSTTSESPLFVFQNSEGFYANTENFPLCSDNSSDNLLDRGLLTFNTSVSCTINGESVSTADHLAVGARGGSINNLYLFLANFSGISNIDDGLHSYYGLFQNETTIVGIYAVAGYIRVDGVNDCSMTEIPEKCFQKLRISSFYVLETTQVTTIGANAFEGCTYLDHVSLYGVTTIKSSAFQNCSLLASIGSVDFVETIGDYAFYGCYCLTKTYPHSNTYTSEGLFLPDSLKTIGESAFENCPSLIKIYHTDGTDAAALTTIGARAFYNCPYLAEVSLPDSVTSIGNRAFENCISLTSFTIPDSVTTIGNYVFNGCSSLATCTFGAGITELGYSGGQGVALFDVDCEVLNTINWSSAASNLTKIHGGMIDSLPPNLTTLALPITMYSNTVIEVDSEFLYSFPYLTSLDLGTGVTQASFDELDFYNVKDTLTHLYVRGSYITNFTSHTWDDNEGLYQDLEALYYVYFEGTTVGELAFFNCFNLSEVEAPNLTTIDHLAFFINDSESK